MANNDKQQLSIKIMIDYSSSDLYNYVAFVDYFHEYHKLNGPAIIRINANKVWYVNGGYSKLNKFNWICNNGGRSFYINNKILYTTV